MINLDRSIVRVKGEILGGGFTRDDLIEIIMHEGAGKDRKTLLKWLNEQVEDIPDGEDDSVPKPGHAPVKPLSEGVVDFTPDAPRSTPIYRPERRGNSWCLYDANNGRMRLETFAVKGDASAFITRLEQDVDGLIEERPYHYLRSE